MYYIILDFSYNLLDIRSALFSKVNIPLLSHFLLSYLFGDELLRTTPWGQDGEKNGQGCFVLLLEASKEKTYLLLKRMTNILILYFYRWQVELLKSSYRCLFTLSGKMPHHISLSKSKVLVLSAQKVQLNVLLFHYKLDVAFALTFSNLNS